MLNTPELPPIIGESPAFLAMMERVSALAPLAKPVLVLGERGTGKELVAARLHYLSPRWDAPLIKVNCAALTESLLESELFGHEAGAFTGAQRTHVGRFERANGGTLVLDELGTIPLRMQEKILRVIEYGEFERVGGSETLTVAVRVLGVTNEDLPALARAGRFRSDLLDRLAFDVVNVPPLRARTEDIPPLARRFALSMTAELQRDYFPGFSAAAADTLLQHPWPGNVRELKNTVERSVYRADDMASPVETIVFDPFETAFSPITAGTSEIAGQAPIPETTAVSLPTSLKSRVAELEKKLITHALDASLYNQKAAADLLKLSYHQLRGYIRKHAIPTGRH